MAGLDEFTTVYRKSADVLKSDGFDNRWSNLKSKVVALFAGTGPDSVQSGVMDTLRHNLAAAAKGQARQAEAIADEILALSRPAVTGYQDRAALIKLLKHFYYVKVAGNQDVWVVDHPSAFTKWSFDQLTGKTAAELRMMLQSEVEAFGEQRRKIMSDSLQLARKWSGDIVVKLAAPSAATLATVKRWFHSADATEAEVKASVKVLLDGFKRISATCNSTTVIFSDHPPERTGGKYGLTLAEVSTVDVIMPVIYIFPHFFMEVGANARGQVGKSWLCALTVIHELSHKLAGTNDNSYDDLGLKPGGRHLTVALALKTADSWGYFAADMAAVLPKQAFDDFYK